MKPRTLSPLTAALLAACLAGPLLAVAAVWHQWSRWADASSALARLGDPDAIRCVRAEEIVPVEREKEALGRQIARATLDLADLQTRQMPVDAHTTRRQILDMLDLAAACGLVVEEMKPIGSDARSLGLAVGADTEQSAGPAAAPAGLAAFINRFSRGPTPRPLVQLRCRGQYATVRGYFTRLQTLRWQVTPVLFEMGQVDRTGRAWTEEEPSPPAPAPADDWPLRLSVIVAL